MSYATLKVHNRAELVNAPGEVIRKIQEANTLLNPKYQDAVKYGRFTGNIPEKIEMWSRIWNGIAFPRGYARQCVGLLRQHGIQYELELLRRELAPVDLQFQGTLRPYQIEAVKAIMSREFGVLESPTGSGKTVIGLAVISSRKQPTLILVHNKELLHQWADRIRSFLGIEPGLIGDGKHKIKPVTVGIVNTVKKHLDSLPEHFGHIVVDECHRTPSSMFTEAVQAFDSRYMLGLSATPYRRDKLTKLIYLALGDRAHQVDQAQLKAQGSVLAPEVVQRETSFRYQYSDDYQDMLSALTEDRQRNEQIAQDVISQARVRSGTALVVSDRVAHCQALAGLIEDSGLQVRVLTGQCSKGEREQIVSEVQAGDVKVLCSTVQLLGEGFDCSGLSSLFLATPIKFKGRILQVVGRILRPEDGKRPVVYDYQDRQVGVLEAQAKARSKALEEVAA